MKYTQINSKLDSALLEKSGFHFDGYYYVSNLCPIRFNRKDDGYLPSLNDDNDPKPGTAIATDYSHLIQIMVQALPIFVGKLMKMKFTDEKHAEAVITKKLDEYWGFDKDLSFSVLTDPMGMRVIPNNEYSYSLQNGGIQKFSVEYQEVGENDLYKEPAELIVEFNPICISWMFLGSIIKEIVGHENFRILYVNMIQGEDFIPYFGAGMPRLVINK